MKRNLKIMIQENFPMTITKKLIAINLLLMKNFIKNFLEESNISINNVDRIDVKPNGNCYMRCVALFIYNNEEEHLIDGNEIANYLSQHSSDYENIKIPTEEGWKSVKEYINYIKLPGKYSGHLKMYAK